MTRNASTATIRRTVAAALLLGKANPKRADSFKESNFRWTWKALDK